MARMDGEQFVSAGQRHGNDRDTRADRHIGGPAPEWTELAIPGSAAFREDEERHAGLERANTVGKTGDGGAGIIDGNGNLAGAIEMPADERELPEVAAREDTKRERQGGGDRRRVPG